MILAHLAVGTLIELFSVGAAVNIDTLETYPMNMDGTPDIEEGVVIPLNECQCHWYGCLSDEDFGIVEYLLTTKNQS